METLRFALTRSARVYLVLLVIAWVGTFFIGAPFIFVIGLNPLSPIAQLLAILISLPVLLLSMLFLRASVVQWKAHFRQPFLRVFPSLGLGALILGFAAMQFIPTHIDGSFTDDSPFDQPWYSARQTAFGFPDPVLRILARPIPKLQIGNHIFDVTSAIVNFLCLASVAAFATLGCNLFLWTCCVLSRKEKAEREAGLGAAH